MMLSRRAIMTYGLILAEVIRYLLYVHVCAATWVYVDTISITDEPWLTRILSKTITGRDDFFRARVRVTDGKCVITGVVNAGAYRNDWVGFETARIFPISSEEYWVQSG
ncbi:hypothetical protein V1507DRAFT_449229 [Lipomyces tetrasporus]